MEITTESDSNYESLEGMTTLDLLNNINREDKTVAHSIEKQIPQIVKLVNEIITKIKDGGRLFYIGAGTSGRIGIVDASECPPTFGVEHGLVIGLMAGGDKAIRKAVEFAEDNSSLGWEDLQYHKINQNDVVVGIAASGNTPYVIGALQKCQEENITTACIVCNTSSPLSKVSDFPIEIVVGPEFVTGSTRMKSGTAQKLVLNMISTSVMIKLGKVKGNKMIDMQLSNNKLVHRGTKMIMKEIEVDYTHKKQSGGSGQFARVKMTFSPNPDKDFEFVNSIKGGNIPTEYIPGVEKGLIQAKESGIIAGFPAIDFKVNLYDGAFHDVDSSVMAFEIASRAAFREGMTKASPVLLEPIMKVECVTPEEYMGDIIGDLNSRRGQVNGMDARGNAQVINAMVPLANMFGYVNNLRSMSQGRAQYTMIFDHYDQVPQAVADEVKAKLA